MCRLKQIIQSKCLQVSVLQVLHMCSRVQAFKRSSVQAFKCSSVQVFKCSSVQVFKCSSVQVFKCPSVQWFEFISVTDSGGFCEWQVNQIQIKIDSHLKKWPRNGQTHYGIHPTISERVQLKQLEIPGGSILVVDFFVFCFLFLKGRRGLWFF